MRVMRSVLVGCGKPLEGRCDDPKWCGVAGFRPCRKCEACRRYDEWFWSSRARLEAIGVRTLFATYTFRPRGDKWLPSDAEVWPDIRNMFKRMRINGLRFRYFCAAEFGDEFGRHHYHVLFHGDIKVRQCRSYWRQGISHARLARKEDFEYVAKYACKQAGRKRASVAYGRGS